jgi:hypothetical protein
MKSNTQTNEIILYQPDSTIKLEVRVENETVWLTQAQIADLFGVQVSAVSKHLCNIFNSNELCENSVVSKMEKTGLTDGIMEAVSSIVDGRISLRTAHGRGIVALAWHSGFTEEELDFIINYDIKYRMGGELGEEE